MGGSTLRTFALPLLLAFFTRQVHPSLVTPAALLGFTLTLVTSDPLSWVVDRGTLVSSSVGVSTQDPAWAEGRGVCEVLVQRKCTSLGPRYHVETCGSPTSTPGTTGDGYNRSMRFYACSGAPPPHAPTPWGPATGQWGGGTATPQWMHQPQDTATTFSASGAWGAGPLGSEGFYGQEGEGLLGGGVELDEEAARLMARGSVLAGLAQRGGALGVARRAAAGSSSSSSGGGGSAAGAAARGRRRGVWDETPEHRLPTATLPGGPPGAQWGGQPYNPSAPAPAQYPLPSACSAASGVGGGTGGISSGGGGGGGVSTTPPTLGSIVCLETTPRIPPVGRGPVSVNLGVASSSAAAGSRCTCFLRHPGDSEIDWSGGQGVNGLGREEEELQRQQLQQQQQNELQFPLHHPGRATSASAATASAMP